MATHPFSHRMATGAPRQTCAGGMRFSFPNTATEAQSADALQLVGDGAGIQSRGSDCGFSPGASAGFTLMRCNQKALFSVPAE